MKTAFLEDALFSSGFPMRVGDVNQEDEKFESMFLRGQKLGFAPDAVHELPYFSVLIGGYHEKN